MPLQEGSSHEAISANIAELIKVGHEPKQAEAIAYKKAGRSHAADEGDDDSDRLAYSDDQPLEVVSVGKEPAPEPEPEDVEEVDEDDVPDDARVINIYEEDGGH